MSDRAGLSDSFAYRNKPHAAAAANIRVTVPPHNKDVFTRGNETIMFNIPCGKRGQYLNTRMSYLKFNVDVELSEPEIATLRTVGGTGNTRLPIGFTQNGVMVNPALSHAVQQGHEYAAAADPNPNAWNDLYKSPIIEPTVQVENSELIAKGVHVLALDGGAHALFNSLEIYHGTNLLEQIREYSAINQLLMDTGIAENELTSHYTVADGMASNDTRKGVVITPVAVKHVNKDTAFLDAKFGKRLAAYYHINGGTDRKWESQIIDVQILPPTPYEEQIVKLLTCTSLRTAISTANLSFKNRDMVKTQAGFPPSPVTVHDGVQLATGGLVIGKKVSYTFCIPIMSGILGPQQSKYIPVGALAADLRLELGLAPFEQAFKSVGALCKHTAPASIRDTSYEYTFCDGPRVLEALQKTPYNYKQNISISGLELQLEYIEVSSDVQSSIEGSTGNQYVFSFESFSNFQNAIPADATAFTQLIGAKFSSIKTVLSLFRDANHINRVTRAGVTSRVNPFSVRPNRPEFGPTNGEPLSCEVYPGGIGYYYSIGATHYPTRPIMSDQEAYYEALKAQHMVTGTPIGTINQNNWTISARRDADGGGASRAYFGACQEGGTFFAAQNFESQSHKSAFVESGINTLSQNMYLHCRFPARLETAGEMAAVEGYLSTLRAGETHGIFTYARQIENKKDFHLTKVPNATTHNWWQYNAQLQVDHFIHYDAVLTIVNGICNTRF